MLASVQAFLEGIIDYAGLFPPAELPLNQAVANYLRYRQQPESWMLGRFICPAGRLKELPAFGDEIVRSGPFRLAVLGRGGKNVEEFLANVRLDLADVLGLGQGLGSAETYEVKLPADVGSSQPSAGQIDEVLNAVADLIEAAPLPQLRPFYECPWPAAAAVDAFAEAMRGTNRAGWKLRCGGLQAAAFPSPQQVARVLAECCLAKIPWKATAGLHHPLRHFDQGLQTSMHGFVNVFGAALLAHAGQIGPAQMVEMLADEDSRNFRVSQAGFSWKNCQVATEAIRLARQYVVTSFGSCSFDEPCDDLRRLGWI